MMLIEAAFDSETAKSWESIEWLPSLSWPLMSSRELRFLFDEPAAVSLLGLVGRPPDPISYALAPKLGKPNLLFEPEMSKLMEDSLSARLRAKASGILPSLEDSLLLN